MEATKIVLARGFAEPLGLQAIARSVHCSAFHLSRIFRSQTGMPIHRYRDALRLRAALERLADGVDDLSALALAVGYYDLSHFSNAFKREFGLSPSLCRRTLSHQRFHQMSKKLQAKTA